MAHPTSPDIEGHIPPPLRAVATHPEVFALLWAHLSGFIPAPAEVVHSNVVRLEALSALADAPLHRIRLVWALTAACELSRDTIRQVIELPDSWFFHSLLTGGHRTPEPNIPSTDEGTQWHMVASALRDHCPLDTVPMVGDLLSGPEHLRYHTPPTTRTDISDGMLCDGYLNAVSQWVAAQRTDGTRDLEPYRGLADEVIAWYMQPRRGDRPQPGAGWRSGPLPKTSTDVFRDITTYHYAAVQVAEPGISAWVLPSSEHFVRLLTAAARSPAHLMP